MKKNASRKHFFGLKTTLIIIGFLGLIPALIASYFYVQKIQVFLSRIQNNALMDSASAFAAVLKDQPAFFSSTTSPTHYSWDEKNLSIHPLKKPIKLDGKTDDWSPFIHQARYYAQKNVLFNRDNKRFPYNPQSLSFQHLLGKYKQHIYALFIVRDEDIIYRRPKSRWLHKSDHLQISLKTPEGQFKRYLLSPHYESVQKGWVNAHLMPKDPENQMAVESETQIAGTWRETKHGYTLEIRIPMDLVGEKLAFAISDVDEASQRKIRTIVGTAGTGHVAELGTLMKHSPEIVNILQGFSDYRNAQSYRRQGTRIWVIDKNCMVRASAGSLKKSMFVAHDTGSEKSLISQLLAPIYRRILEQPSSEFYDDPELNHCDKNLNIMKALEHGAPQIDIRYATTGNMAILSAIKPIISKENHILGTVIVEKSVNDIVHERNRAIEDMLNSLIIAFLFALIILLIFSSRLTRRIRSLRTEAMAATDSEGRVINTNIHGSQWRDELGDLAYELSTKLQMIGQYTNDLEEYNQYLRQYKDKLRHEMQTPTSVVQSSLELLEMEDIPPSAGKYVERAKKGVSTLGMILKSLSEAKNLEDAINNELREDFNIDQEIAEHIENYQFIYPAQTFQYKSTAKDICLHGSPHLIRIMLDKLIDNAVDFTENQQPILISLIKDTTHVCLQVKNSGQPLPQEMLSHLFNFMISMRLPENDNPHLGLGLYIVKLVAEFHGGQVKAESSTDDDGAIFSIIFPLNDTPPK